MLKSLILVPACAISSIAFAQDAQVIQIKTYERTESAIVVEGVANIIPIGTKMWVTVTSINGKQVDESRNTIKTIEDVLILPDRSFKATIKRYGSLTSYPFPDGKYRLVFYAGFNRAWQSIDVARTAGVSLDEQGRSDFGEPHKLPKSPDLVTEAMGSERARFLKARRTIDIHPRADESSRFRTKSIRLEVHDVSVLRNPIRTLSGTDLLVREVPQKVGRLTGTQAVSLVCVGAFGNGFGYLADDLIRSSGRYNSTFTINFATTLFDVCHQQEEAFERRKR